MALKSVLVKSNEKPNNCLECPICKETFWLRCKYDDHIATNHRFSLSCNICSKSFYDQKLLDEHYLTHTEVIRTYNCNECPRKFLQKYQLEQHMQFHKPVDLKKCNVINKKCVNKKSTIHVKNIVNTYFSEEFTDDDEEDYEDYSETDEESEFSEFEDYLPASKIVKTRSGRLIKRKKLFDEEETEIIHKSPKTIEPASIEKSTITKFNSQKNKPSKVSCTNELQNDIIAHDIKRKQVFDEEETEIKPKFSKIIEPACIVKSTITKSNTSKKSKSSKVSRINELQNDIMNKELTVVVEKMPDNIYAQYLKKRNAPTEKQPNSGIHCQTNSKKSMNNKKICPKKEKSNLKKVTPHFKKRCNPYSDSPTDTVKNEKSKATVSNKFQKKNIAVSSPQSSKPIQNDASDELSKVPIGRVKPLRKEKSIDAVVSSVTKIFPHVSSSCKSQTGKQYMYVGHNPDINKIKKVIEEVNTMSNKEISHSHNISKKNIYALNTPISNMKGTNNMHLTNTVSPTDLNAASVHCNLGSKKDGLPGSDINSQTNNNLEHGNQLKESIPVVDGVLDKKVVGEFILVKVTPECMKKMQQNHLEHPSISSQQNLSPSSSKTVSKIVSTHITSNLSKIPTVPAKNLEITSKSQISNAVTSTSFESDRINNVSKTISSPGTLLVNSEETLKESQTSTTASFDAHSNNDAIKSLSTRSVETIFLNNQETSRENTIFNDDTSTLFEVPIVNNSNNCLENSMLNLKALNKQVESDNVLPVVSNVKKIVTSPTDKQVQEIRKEIEKSKAFANTSFEINRIYNTRQVFQSHSAVKTASTDLNSSAASAVSETPATESKTFTVIKMPDLRNKRSQNLKPKSPNVSLVHSKVTTIHSPTVFLLRMPAIQNPTVGSLQTRMPITQNATDDLLQTRMPTVQSPIGSLLHARTPTIQRPTVGSLYTRMPSIQTPTVGSSYSRMSTPKRKKLHNEEIKEILPDVKQEKTIENEISIAIVDTSLYLNKNDNSEIDQRKSNDTSPVSNKKGQTLQMSHSKLSKLQDGNTAELVPNCITLFESNGAEQVDDSVELYQRFKDEDLIPSKNVDENNQISLQTDNMSILSANNNENILKTPDTAFGNSIFEDDENDTIEAIESISFEQAIITHDKIDENKMTSTEDNSNDPERNIVVEGFDSAQSMFEKNIHEKSSSDNDAYKKGSDNDSVHEDENSSNSIEIVSTVCQNEISPSEKNLTVTADENKVTKESHDILPDFSMLFSIGEDNLNISQENLSEDVQKLRQSNFDNLLAAVSIAKKSLEDGQSESPKNHLEEKLCDTSEPRENIYKDVITETEEQDLQGNCHGLSSKFAINENMEQNEIEHSEESEKKSPDNRNYFNTLSELILNNNSKNASPENNEATSSAKGFHLSSDMLQRFNAKLEEKERKKKLKYEFKKRMRYIENVLASPSRNSDERKFGKEIRYCSDDATKVSEQCTLGSQKKNNELTWDLKFPFQPFEVGSLSILPISATPDKCSETENISTEQYLNNSKDFTDSSLRSIKVSSQERKKSENPCFTHLTHSKSVEEAIARAHTISQEFNKNMSENDCLSLLDELEEIIVTYKSGDNFKFINPVIRYCRLFIDSYKVKQKANSLDVKLKNVYSS